MVTMLRSFWELATSRLATRNWPLVYSMLVIAPAMGARFTCTSKMFRKMLMRAHAGSSRAYGDHFSVGGRNGHGAVRDGAIGIAKKIEAECSQKEQRHAESGAAQIPDCGAAGTEREGIVDPVDHHGHFYCTGGGAQAGGLHYGDLQNVAAI